MTLTYYDNLAEEEGMLSIWYMLCDLCRWLWGHIAWYFSHMTILSWIVLAQGILIIFLFWIDFMPAMRYFGKGVRWGKRLRKEN